MAMESNDNLTSYLKSMFVQFHGEEQLPPPPPQAPSSAPAPVASSSQSTASETASTSSMAVEGTTSEPLTNYEEETDVNNNSESPAKNASPLKLMTNGNSTIEVNVDVHHSDNDSIDASRGESSGSEEVTVIAAESPQPVQTTLAHNKIALTFLDELKQTLQSNEGNDADAPTTEQAVHPTEQSLVVQTDSGSSADRRKEEEKTPFSPPPQPAARAIEASSSSSSSVAEEATSSTAESGIQEDIDDAVFSGQGSSTASTPTLESDIVSSPPSSSSSNRLVRSASSNVFSSSSSSQSNGGPPSTSGRRVLRSVSQDVRFKLESIKEEKKVTKAHVSELANFWKGKMISPKDKS